MKPFHQWLQDLEEHLRSKEEIPIKRECIDNTSETIESCYNKINELLKNGKIKINPTTITNNTFANAKWDLVECEKCLGGGEYYKRRDYDKD